MQVAREVLRRRSSSVDVHETILDRDTVQLRPITKLYLSNLDDRVSNEDIHVLLLLLFLLLFFIIIIIFVEILLSAFSLILRCCCYLSLLLQYHVITSVIMSLSTKHKQRSDMKLILTPIIILKK